MRVFECNCTSSLPHSSSPSQSSRCAFSFFIPPFFLFLPLLPSFPSFLFSPRTLCLSPRVPPSRCCSIFKRACSAQVILAAAGEGSDKSLMVEKRVCGILGSQQQCQLTCRKKERWTTEETGGR